MDFVIKLRLEASESLEKILWRLVDAVSPSTVKRVTISGEQLTSQAKPEEAKAVESPEPEKTPEPVPEKPAKPKREQKPKPEPKSVKDVKDEVKELVKDLGLEPQEVKMLSKEDTLEAIERCRRRLEGDYKKNPQPELHKKVSDSLKGLAKEISGGKTSKPTELDPSLIGQFIAQADALVLGDDGDIVEDMPLSF